MNRLFRQAALPLLRQTARLERRVIAPWRGLRFPEFLCIGPPQSGTKWLHVNLTGHPEIAVPIKEVGYFDALTHRSAAWYAHRLNTSAPILGDMTPNYIRLAPRSIHEICRLMPDVKLIVMLRDPVDRAWSAFRRKELDPRSSPMVQDIEEFLERIRESAPPGALKIDHGDYRTALTHWLSVFRREQLLPIPFPHIASQPEFVLRRVLNHLGADPSLVSELPAVNKQINRNPDHRLPTDVRAYLEDRYQFQREAVEAALGLSWLTPPTAAPA